MTDLMELASRVEAGEGPDRELDAEIACIIGRPLGDVNHWLHGADISYQPTTHGYYVAHIPTENGDTRTSEAFKARDFTSSLDDARSLVPKGLRLMLSEWDDEKHLRSKGPWQAVLSKPGQDASFDVMRGYRCEHAATPALALTAAALRARAHQGTAHVEQ